MIKNLYATHHSLSLMLSRTILIFTASGSFCNDSLNQFSSKFKNFLLKGRGYATYDRNAAFNLIPLGTDCHLNNPML
jgi:hypothetical protein